MRNIQEITNIAIDKSCLTLSKAFLAGLLISIGGMFMLNVNSIGLINGFAFSLALISIVFTGANLFTGQCLYQQFHYQKYRQWKDNVWNLVFSWFGNLYGCILTSIAFAFSLPSPQVKTFLENIVLNKINLPIFSMILRGILCNILVCLALFICLRAKDNISKIAAIILCVSAFIACGFEHSIANMFFLTTGYLFSMISIFQELHNLLYVTIGNMIGAWIFYLFIKE